MLQASDSWIIPRYENGLKFQVAVVVVVVLKLIGFVYVSDIGQIRLPENLPKEKCGCFTTTREKDVVLVTSLKTSM